MKYANLLALPFAIIAISVLAYSFLYDNSEIAIWAILPTIILAIIYISKSQIEWFFAKRNPPKLNEIEKKLISTNAHYISLDEKGKKKYEDRLSLIMLTRNFTYQHSDKPQLPRDIELQICMPITTYTFDDENYFQDEVQYIVVYPHPFLSPAYEDVVHISEYEGSDGVLIFSLAHLIPGFTHQSINLAAYEWAQAYLDKYQKRLNCTEDQCNQLLNDCLGVGIDKLIVYFNHIPINYDALVLALLYEFPQYASILKKDQYKVAQSILKII